MNMHRTIHTPVTSDDVAGLRAGNYVFLNCPVYTARDRAHQRLKEITECGKSFPFDPSGMFLYYMGPSPARPGSIIGSAGPTTSYRMDAYSELMLSSGIKGMIGKGKRDAETKRLLCKWTGVYFSTFGGAGAYLSKKIVSAEIIAFHDLGPEAIYRLFVKDFPLIVINDSQGSDLYEYTR